MGDTSPLLWIFWKLTTISSIWECVHLLEFLNTLVPYYFSVVLQIVYTFLKFEIGWYVLSRHSNCRFRSLECNILFIIPDLQMLLLKILTSKLEISFWPAIKTIFSNLVAIHILCSEKFTALKHNRFNSEINNNDSETLLWFCYLRQSLVRSISTNTFWLNHNKFLLLNAALFILCILWI